jgi:glycosyltransferase involved in cell wall biosynthesis
LTIVRQLQELGYETRVLWLSRLSNPSGSELRLRKHWLGIPVPPFNAGNKFICKATRLISRLVARAMMMIWRIELIVTEGPTVAAVCTGNGVPVICDFHGDVREEWTMDAFPGWESRLAAEDERIACVKTAGWICASYALQQVLRARHGVSAPSVIVPSCVDISRYATYEERREKARADLGLDGRWVVCYVGGLSRWQEIPQTLRLVAAMRSKEPRVFFLFITSDKADMYASELSALGEEKKDYICRSLTHAGVLEMLPAADLGFLLRAASPVNFVSSPTKCGEYLASGVPVVTTAHAGDAPRIVSMANAGLVLDGDASQEENADAIISYLRASMEDRVAVARRSHLAAFENYSVVPRRQDIARLVMEVLRSDGAYESNQRSDAGVQD